MALYGVFHPSLCGLFIRPYSYIFPRKCNPIRSPSLRGGRFKLRWKAYRDPFAAILDDDPIQGHSSELLYPYYLSSAKHLRGSHGLIMSMSNRIRKKVRGNMESMLHFVPPCQQYGEY